MIILVDKEELAIELCKDSKDLRNIYIEAGYENWKALAELHSELGKRIFLSGDEAEEWLDDAGIYYIHMDREDCGETIGGFRERLEGAIALRRPLLDRSRIVDGKGETLVYGIVRDGSGERATFLTDNSLELVRDSSGEYHTTLRIGDGKSIVEAISELSGIIAKAEGDFGETGFCVEEMDFYDDLNLASSKSVAEAISKLKMRLGIMMASAGMLN